MTTIQLPMGPYAQPPTPPGNPRREDRPEGVDPNRWEEFVWKGVRWAPKLEDRYYLFTPPDFGPRWPTNPCAGQTIRVEW